MKLPERETANLRLGRISIPGAWYFVTTTTSRRKGLFSEESIRRIPTEILQMAFLGGDCIAFASCVMPEHWHLVFQLGDRLTLSRLMSKLKANVSRAISVPGRIWQENFFEHRIRDSESLESFVFYVFMNPYVSGLITPDQHWDGWAVENLPRLRFLDQMRIGPLPQREWIDRAGRMKMPGCGE